MSGATGLSGEGDLLTGGILALVGVQGLALSNITNKKDSQYIPAKTYLFTQWLCGSLISIVLFFVLGGEIEPLNSSANLRLMGLVFIDIFNYSLFFYTITGITLGYIFLDEIVNNVFYPTLLLIFVSLYLAVKDEANNLS